MNTFVRVLQDLTLLVVRILFGLLLLAHAWHRYRQVGMAHEIAYLTAHHLPQPTVLAWGALGLETVGGVMLVFGLLVPLVGLALVVQNVLTAVWLTWGNGTYRFHQGFETNLVQGLLALVLTTFGGGRAAIDALWRRPREDAERRVIREHA